MTMDEGELAEMARLRTALDTIQNYFEKGDLDAAYGMCESTLRGKLTTSHMASLPDNQRLVRFAANFNELTVKYGIRAAFLAMLPIPGDTESLSFHTDGENYVAKYIERTINKDKPEINGYGGG